MDVQSITAEKLVEIKQAATYLGKCAMWTMSSEMFLHIRRLKDADQNYVYPFPPDFAFEGDILPPLLGLPVDVSHTYSGISIRTISAPGIPSRIHDPIEHPKHYTSHPSGIECIQITEYMGFNLGNAVKYIWRADLKHDDALEDLRKAKWYIEREIAKRGK